MDPLPCPVELREVASGRTISATLVRLTRQLAKLGIDSKWWELPDVSKSRRAEEIDNSWQWAKKVGELSTDRWHEMTAVQTADDRVQGAIYYRLDTRSFIDRELGAVYVEAIATAPRNRQNLVETPEYRGVGCALLLRAVIHSYELGFGGRVNLQASDDPDRIAFYENRGFQVVGDEGTGENRLVMMELTPEAAAVWLAKEGYES